MNKIIWGTDDQEALNEAMARWMVAQIWGPDSKKTMGNCRCFGVMRNEKLIAVQCFHNWEPDTGVIEFSGAATDPRWLSPAVLKEMFDYPFRVLGCQLLVTRNSINNKRLHRQLKSYGFEHVVIPRLAGRNEDQVIWTLTDDAWKAGKFYKEE